MPFSLATDDTAQALFFVERVASGDLPLRDLTRLFRMQNERAMAVVAALQVPPSPSLPLPCLPLLLLLLFCECVRVCCLPIADTLCAASADCPPHGAHASVPRAHQLCAGLPHGGPALYRLDQSSLFFLLSLSFGGIARHAFA